MKGNEMAYCLVELLGDCWGTAMVVKLDTEMVGEMAELRGNQPQAERSDVLMA